MKKKQLNHGFRLGKLEQRGENGKIHLQLNRNLKPYQWWLLPPFSEEREKARIAYMGANA